MDLLWRPEPMPAVLNCPFLIALALPKARESLPEVDLWRGGCAVAFALAHALRLMTLWTWRVRSQLLELPQRALARS
eukprot:6160685-Pyramimonas_sp.AAC.1